MLTTINHIILYIFIWYSMLALSLSLFRFPLKANKLQLMYSIILLTCISVPIQHFKVVYLITIIQPIAMMGCLFIIFRLRFLYTIIMTIIPYTITILLELFVVLIKNLFKYDTSVIELQGDNLTSAWIVIVLTFVLVFLLKKLRLGFSFIPRNKKNDPFLNDNKNSIITFVYIIVILLNLGSIILFHFEGYLLLLQFITMFALLLLLSLAYKKDLES